MRGHESPKSDPVISPTVEEAREKVMSVQQARDVLLGDIRYCISAVRGDSSAPVGDCSVFVDELIAALRAERSPAVPEAGWQDISTAPTDGTPIIVLTEGGVVLKAEASDGVCEDGWAWIASVEDVHPRCWTDGVCWAENADWEPSDQPIRWMPMPLPAAPPADGEA